MRWYNPKIGEDVAFSCERAAELAVATCETVHLKFNDVELIVRPGERAAAVRQRWTRELQRRSIVFDASPAGIAEAHARAATRDEHQCRTDGLVAALHGAVQSLDTLVRWCVALAEAADHIGVSWDPYAAAETIKAAGYKANVHCGEPFRLTSDWQKAGEYLVGQTLASLDNGMPPRSIVADFAMQAGFLDE